MYYRQVTVCSGLHLQKTEFDRLGVKNTIEGRGKGGCFHVKKNKGQSLIPRLLTLLYKGKRKERKIYKKKEVQIPKHLNTCVLVLPGDN